MPAPQQGIALCRRQAVNTGMLRPSLPQCGQRVNLKTPAGTDSTNSRQPSQKPKQEPSQQQSATNADDEATEAQSHPRHARAVLAKRARQPCASTACSPNVPLRGAAAPPPDSTRARCTPRPARSHLAHGANPDQIKRNSADSTSDPSARCTSRNLSISRQNRTPEQENTAENGGLAVGCKNLKRLTHIF